MADVNSEVLFLAGAGVSTTHDVKAALELGCDGALLASAFVKSAEPKAFAQGMLKEVKEFGRLF